MPEPSSRRYAIYYTPAPEHPLTVAASAWRGRDAFAGGPATAPAGHVAAATDTVRVALTEPRRYGFHATLKAPFRLKEGTTVEELEQVLRRFVSESPAVRTLLDEILASLLAEDYSVDALSLFAQGASRRGFCGALAVCPEEPQRPQGAV